MTKIQIARPYIDREDERGVLEVLRSGNLSLGPKFVEFEQAITQYTQASYACAVANGTCGLHLAVKALDLKDGDEVITSPFSFISSSNCLLFERAKPVFVDIEETTFNMNPLLIEKAITKKTKAILVVHIFGQSADMTEILKIARKYKLPIIEDACESLGSVYKDKMTGTMGDIGVFAFYPNKQMTTGEGGMIVTKSKKLYELMKSMRNQGRNTQGDWLIHERIGYNYRMDEMSASLGVTQLKKLPWMIQKKAQIASWYTSILSQDSRIITPQVGTDRTHSWFVYVVRITTGNRNQVMEKLAKKGIQTKPYLPVIHLQPFMKKMFGYKKGDYQIAEKVSAQTLALPFFIGLKKKDVELVCKEVQKAL
jgi:perosamine synthetase